jgi:uncharacterized ferritin-like protein (DUF455 family)
VALDCHPLRHKPNAAKVGTPAALEARDLLHIILTEEVGHVAAGNRWFHWLCELQQLDPGGFYAKAATGLRRPQTQTPVQLRRPACSGLHARRIAKIG